VQAPDTVLVNLEPSAPAILENMKNKCRYNIGLAEKKGVKISRPDEQGLDAFYRLLGETAERDGIAVHGIEYYRGLFESARDYNLSGKSGPDVRLYLAGHEEDVLAAIVVLVRRGEAVYLYGASSNKKRNLMAPHALQWRAMLDAKESGCVEYDLFGIPPNEDPAHPMAGLYRFKTGFGGRIVHRPGSWDYAYRPLLNSAFKTAEHFRKTLRDKKKKRER
jgi:lipid II:glycine glycyltransferase (peptidoglycan interpeptide bridge formation enzyme)